MENKQDQFDEEAAKKEPDIKLLKNMQEMIDYMSERITKLRGLLNGVTANKLMLERA